MPQNHAARAKLPDDTATALGLLMLGVPGDGRMKGRAWTFPLSGKTHGGAAGKRDEPASHCPVRWLQEG
ncbi:hypothetical protein HZ994_10960 [Akkermansiaceae bacterium]|nr:hypothetical protein HZ994_10960 [Akkermansiaceae bacterium]